MYTPLFEKWVWTTHFYERPTLVPVFDNQEKSEEDFCFYQKKGEKLKQCRAFVLKDPLQKVAHSLSPRAAWLSSCPGNSTQHLSIKLPWLWTVSVSICALAWFFCASISRMCSKVSEMLKGVIFWVWEHSKTFPYKLMVTTSLWSFQCITCFYRNSLFLDSGGKPV